MLNSVSKEETNSSWTSFQIDSLAYRMKACKTSDTNEVETGRKHNTIAHEAWQAGIYYTQLPQRAARLGS